MSYTDKLESMSYMDKLESMSYMDKLESMSYMCMAETAAVRLLQISPLRHRVHREFLSKLRDLCVSVVAMR